MTGPEPPHRSGPAEHVDAVVVGSGFGGSVSAFRLAEAGRSVVLLERGRAYPPGSFPRSPQEMGRAFWDPDEGLRGLFDVWSFDGFESIVSAGLGGGSLIYANVLLRKDERWFVREDPLPRGGYETWPVTRADLDPHYDAVERMLTPAPYPFDSAPFADTRKTHELRESAQRLGLDWQLPPLAVSFASRPGATPEVGATVEEAPYGNLHGLPRRTCDLDGACDIGCNAGAKNSLDHTYLSAAAHHGADLRTLAEVTAIQPLDGGGYRVDYLAHDPDDAAAPPRHVHLTADRVILGAGTYGTTLLLLRNRSVLPGLGDALGTRFSGNGDLLTCLMPGEQERQFRASHGPVITSTIRVGDSLDHQDHDGRGFYLQDGGYPGFVEWLIQPLQGSQALRTAAFVLDWLGRRLWHHDDPRLGDEVSRMIGDGSMTAGSLPLLGMGRDVPDGVMSLRDKRLDVQWTTETSKDYFGRVRDTMSAIADDLGVRLQDNPLWFFRRVVTVHPLGGAPMATAPEHGVCDPYGEVFGHPGLHVADGAAMPGSVGPNPSLTIAAHADRMATAILEDRTPARRRTSRAPSPPAAVTEPDAGSTGLSFTERMSGAVTPGEIDPAAGATGRYARELTVHLTITIDDVAEFVTDPSHAADVRGRVECELLGGQVEVGRGWFHLFVPGPRPDERRMTYLLQLTDAAGNPWTVKGHKEIRDDPGLDVWSDTTTLYTRLLVGHVDPVRAADAVGGVGSPIAAAGVLRIGERDLVRQLGTFATSGPGGLKALVRFGRFFLGSLWDVYGAHAKSDPEEGRTP